MIDYEALDFDCDFDWPDIEIDFFVWQWPENNEGTQQNQHSLRTNYETASASNHAQCDESALSQGQGETICFAFDFGKKN